MIKTMTSYILKSRSVKMKVFAVSILILVVHLIVSYIVFEKWYKQQSKVQKVSKDPKPVNITFEYIVVHFDLKGSPPKLAYLKSILKMLKDHRVNALLIEYEDMFPYEGKLANLSAQNCYSKGELKQFLMSAVKDGFEIIPLVQTFGHLEFALKLEELKHLREQIKFPDSICPSKNQSQELIREMLQQVINFHNTIAPLKHIHIGCDEVFHLKTCELCYKRKLNKLGIFISHVKFVTNVIRGITSKTKILVWDDMFRSIKPMQSIDLRFSNVESVYWDYHTENIDAIHPTLFKYQRMFDKLWVATAYKGADGPTRTLPNLNLRFGNHLAWLDFILKYGSTSKIYHFKGIILTGWSRYSHFEPPCELLPVAIPSLILNLILIGKYLNGNVFEPPRTITEFHQKKQAYIQTHIANDFNSALSCQNSIFEGTLESFHAMACVFDGSDLYANLQRSTHFRNIYLFKYLGGHDSLLSNELNMDDLKLGYLKVERVKRVIDEAIGGIQEVIIVESQMIEAMSNYFDKHTVAEYVVLKLSVIKKKMFDLLQLMSDHNVVKDWPRRPFNISTEWKDNDLQLID